MRPYRISVARAHVALVALLALPLAGASAQRAAAPAPRVMIPTFMSAEKDLGLQAAEALRNRVTRDTDVRRLIVIPKADINNTLNASGYSTTEPLQPNDAKALAVLLRADEYMDGVVTKTPTGVKIEARLVLARDQNLAQPLPAAEAPKLDQAAAAVSKSYQAAREQLANEKTCYTLLREGKHNEAVAAGRSALSKYPNGTIAMVCIANAYQELKQPDSVLAIAERITAIDSRNIPALRFQADIYGSKQNSAKQLEALTRLMAAEPSNDRLREQVIASLVQAGKAADAIPIIEEALRSNPGDPQTLRTAWRVYLAANRPDKALATGTEMIKADTALADSAYFVRTSSALSATNPTQAAAVVAQGIAKFPSNATLLVVQATTLNKAGQNAQALAAINRALAVNPKVDGGFTQKAAIFSALNQPDSVVATLRSASAAAGADKKTLSAVALKTGNDLYKAAKDRDGYTRAIAVLKFADELDSSPTAKFLVGVSSFRIGQLAVDDAQKAGSNKTIGCQLARTAKDAFAAAQENVPAGLQEYPEPAKQVLTGIPQYTPAVDDMIRRLCK